MEPKKKLPKILLIVGAALSGAVLTCAAVLGVLWLVNDFTLTAALLGEPEMVIEHGAVFEDPGAEGDFRGTVFVKEPVSAQVRVEGAVDSGTLGEYVLTYHVEHTLDCLLWKQGYTQSLSRTVRVVDTTAPEITLVSDPEGYTIPGQTYVEEGFTAIDSCDGDLTDKVVRTATQEKVTYTVTDASGNKAEVVRTIFYHDPVPPVLTLNGKETMSLTQGNIFKDPGCTAYDELDGDLTDKIQVTGEVNNKKPGEYVLEYSVTDSYGNTVTAKRTVKVTVLPDIPDIPKVDLDNPVEPTGKVIYLTFDDGPSKHTPRLLDVLKKYNVKATFFVVGTSYISTVQRIAAEGHSIGMHSATHNLNKIYTSEAAYFEDLQKIQGLIQQYTGKAPTILRFPGGSSNTASNYNPGIMTRLTKKVKELGYRYYDWNVSSGDGGGATTSERVYANVVRGIGNKKISVVLQHDIKGFSVDAVEWIIQWGLANGYTFLPLDTTSPRCEHRVNN